MTTNGFSFNEKSIAQYKNAVTNGVLFKAAMAKTLPMGIVASLSIKNISNERCEVTVPYKYVNKNPFGTTYWAVLGMAAEMAPGALVMMYARNLKPSVSTFVVGCEAKFVKTAVGLTTFVTEDGLEIAEKIKATCLTFEPQEIITKSIGYNTKGEVVAEFVFTWGVKARRPK